jgi:hypothetical protein
MRQMLRKIGYFFPTLLVFAGLGAGCEKIENTPPTQNDSLAVIPVGPGTRPDVIVPPDTPRSDAESPADSTTSSGAKRP